MVVRSVIMLVAFSVVLLACQERGISGKSSQHPATILDSSKGKDRAMNEKITKADSEWKRQLTPEQYEVTRNQGTED